MGNELHGPGSPDPLVPASSIAAPVTNTGGFDHAACRKRLLDETGGPGGPPLHEPALLHDRTRLLLLLQSGIGIRACGCSGHDPADIRRGQLRLWHNRYLLPSSHEVRFRAMAQPVSMADLGAIWPKAERLLLGYFRGKADADLCTPLPQCLPQADSRRPRWRARGERMGSEAERADRLG
jgi:hypothetical protein